ncbi:MAG: PrgI family protein [Acidimicrobiia bacterium]|nr:PrgI family protein [Acidimicrobiia bacterium]
MSDERTASYVFGPLQRPSALGGLGAPQVATIAAGGALGVVALRLSPTPMGLGTAVVAVSTAMALALVRIGGRRLEEWAPAVGRWAAGWRQRRWLSRAPVTGAAPHAHAGRHPLSPPPLRGVEVMTVVVPGVGEIGVVTDDAEGTYTAALVAAGSAFALLDTDGKQRRLAAWADVLRGRAREGGALYRLAWLDTAAAEDGAEAAAYLTDHRALDADAGALRSYRELVASQASRGQRHEVVIAVSVSARSKAVRAAGAGERGTCVSLIRELDQVAARLISAELSVVGALGPAALRGLVHGGGSGPVATETHWDSYRVDDRWHATLWVSEWPRVPVGPDFLAPLLLETTAVRRVGVVMAPVPPAKATKAVEMARTHFLSDEELRARAGFLATARRQREHEGIVRRERDLADGHLEYQYSAYVTVSAPGRAELEAAVAEVSEAASRSRLELRRLYGQQDVAFTMTLPIGRGLR